MFGRTRQEKHQHARGELMVRGPPTLTRHEPAIAAVAIRPNETLHLAHANPKTLRRSPLRNPLRRNLSQHNQTLALQSAHRQYPFSHPRPASTQRGHSYFAKRGHSYFALTPEDSRLTMPDAPLCSWPQRYE